MIKNRPKVGETKKPLTHAEAGRLGGKALVEKRGKEYMSNIGTKGGVKSQKQKIEKTAAELRELKRQVTVEEIP